MRLVFATNNLNKLKEVQEMLSDQIELLSLKDIGCSEEIEETATTLEGNAKLKADYITEHYGYDCFADDTGLEVDSLLGAPGVYSARYGGEPRSADKNIEKLLTEIEDKEDRSAQFRTIITLNLDDKSYDFEGICKGLILKKRSGSKGFGYDPVFQPEGYSLSFAEMSSDEKNSISHRGIAIQKLVQFLNNID
ncbi:non-canonical purine NTP diphosphatase [Pseudotenacibaculum sp. MALMAid0570]|uniref:non-canonical purine NTP diphosphatase n=1 Tax=Pseudotenacibaculum sp. MALMAid0570 TaxID=3143938 RepID=UPI0032DF46FE